MDPEGGENPNKDKLLRNLVLACIHCWMQKGTRELVHSAAKKGFLENDIKEAAVMLTQVGLKFHDRRGSAKRSKVDLFLDDILNHLYELEDRAHLPVITVDSASLAKMPQGPMAAGDTVEVSTRLGNLEKQLSDMNVAIAAIAAGGGARGGVASAPVINVEKERTYASAAGGSGASAHPPPSQRQNQATAQVGAGPSNPTANRFSVLGVPDQDFRPRSASQKRKLSDGSAMEVEDFHKQKQRGFKGEKEKNSGAAPRRATNVGTGKSDNVNNAGKVAPFEMYVGRTHPETTEEDIRAVLNDYTKSDQKENGVEIIDVDLLAEMKDTKERVISKCWRVTFPFADKEIMMAGSSWPAGWTYRQYFPPRKPKQAIQLYKKQE